jgi:hypothetical protein
MISMNLDKYPEDVRKFVNELLRRNIIHEDDVLDPMLINYLSTQKYDEDYIDTIMQRFGLKK